jgi:hypothetical protein
MVNRFKDVVKLGEEEAEALEDFLDSDSYKVLVDKVLPALIDQCNSRILNIQVTDQQALLRLAILKAEYDGAKRLAADIKALKKASRTGAGMQSKMDN